MLFVLMASAADVVGPDYAGHCQAVVWNQDGSKLSWEVNYLEKKTIELFVAAFDGAALGSARKIMPASSGSSSSMTQGFSSSRESVIHELSFSPVSMQHFVYAASGLAQDYDLYLDSGNSIGSGPGTDDGAVWSPDGTKIVFSSARSGQGDLYLIDVLNPDRAPLRLTGVETSAELYAAWSPDSKKLAFVGHTSSGDQLYLIEDVNFPAPMPITAWEHTQTRPVWSPDGKTIAFYSNHSDLHRYDLYALPLRGTATLIDTGVVLNPRGPAWTADSEYLVYVKEESALLNPVYAAPLINPRGKIRVDTGTVGNQDLALVRRGDGVMWLAVTAMGRVNDTVRDFRRVFVQKLGI